MDVFPGLVAVVFSLSAEEAEDNDGREASLLYGNVLSTFDIILCCSREG